MIGPIILEKGIKIKLPKGQLNFEYFYSFV